MSTKNDVEVKIQPEQKREQWGSQLGFILASAGSAVGLGNVWKFPYMTGTNGGAAFVAVYLIIILLIGASMLLVDFVVGRYGKSNAVDAYKKISSKFAWMGYLGILCAILVLSYYAVIGGWIIHYMLNSFTTLTTIAPEQVGDFFGSFIGNPILPLIPQFFFMFFTVYIVMKGIKNGIEKWNKILMPALLVMLVVLAFRSLTLDGAMAGVEFYLKPDFSKVTMALIVAACGQVFFSLNVGTTGMVVYGSYLSEKTNIPKSTVSIILTDTAVALLAGLIVIPAAFAFGVEPGSGPSLVFITVPGLFSQIPFGGFFSFIFFTLLLFASITSSVSILEIVVPFMIEKFNFERKKSCIGTGIACFVLGIPVSLGFGIWSNITIFGKTFFDLFDYFASNISYPIIGLFSAIMVGWVWGKKNAMEQVSSNGLYTSKINGIWFFAVKYICPIALIIICLSSLGIIK
ncbi:MULTISPECIES: sodium-dependent transporter [unclassified Sedimentibacter]|uniref:sodium-dependent transporter n=1 Tax=unclassified Sedimentibacter TaxID=2649220 RepID=UPI0027E10483|nr:sodium-dependent transporter [Sedimentibacter sp. MB35-C1]WMJ77742.1 sodium-dependent transporter [Sedimentibacter sp. MB35-C1]